MREFIKSQDLAQVQTWKADLNLECVPESGLIEDGVASVFFYKTGTGVLFVDGMIDNPEADRKLVVKAMKVGAAEILAYARTVKAKMVVVPAKSPSFVRMLRKAGAQGAVVPVDLCYIYPEL